MKKNSDPLSEREQKIVEMIETAYRKQFSDIKELIQTFYVEDSLDINIIAAQLTKELNVKVKPFLLRRLILDPWHKKKDGEAF